MTDNKCYQGCSSVAVLYGTFTRVDGVVFTASMSASNNGCTPCDAQNNAQNYLESVVLVNFLMEYTPQIIDYTYHIEYTNKCGEMIIGELCYNSSDLFNVEYVLYRSIKNFTVDENESETAYSAMIAAFADIINSTGDSLGYSSHSYVTVLPKGSPENNIQPIMNMRAQILNEVDCYITNIRTKQRIPSKIIINLIQGFGGANVSPVDYRHTKTDLTLTTFGSKISPNGFRVKTVDGALGSSLGIYSNTSSDGALIYKVDVIFKDVQTSSGV